MSPVERQTNLDLARIAIAATRYRHRFVGGAVAAISLLCCGASIAADSFETNLTPRGAAKIIGLIVPDFPAQLVKADSSLEVQVRLMVDERGIVHDVQVESTPGPADKSVVEAVKLWFVIPDVCRGTKWTSSIVRTTLVFTFEDEKRFVTVRDPQWFAAGVDENLPGAETSGAKPPVKLREPAAKPSYPREALARGVYAGIVVGVLKFGADGKAIGILQMFQWPTGVFERAVTRSVMSWEADTEDIYVKQGKPFEACFEINFKAR